MRLIDGACPNCGQRMLPRSDAMIWECRCGFTVTDQERRMAGGPMPQQRLSDLDLSRFGYGSTCMVTSIRVRAGDQWSNPSAGIGEGPFTTTTISPSPTGTDEVGPEHPRQDAEEFRRIREETRQRQAEVEQRARALLVEVIGEPAVQVLEAGGTYAVPSARWPGTEYHIPKQGYLKIVKGGLWQEVCLVSSDERLPWADKVLSRIKMIEANETIVQGRGNRQGASPNRTLEQLRDTIEKLLNPRQGPRR